jgi:hypothetical protein
LLQQRRSKKVLYILAIIVGALIFLSNLITHIRYAGTYIGTLYDNPFTYLIATLFGRLGWNLHFGATLLLIGLWPFVKKRSTVAANVETDMEQHNTAAAISPLQKDLSVAGWFGTLILTAIPLVNLIVLLIWSFGSDDPRRNFSRAHLLYAAIMFVIVIIILIATSSIWGLYY